MTLLQEREDLLSRYQKVFSRWRSLDYTITVNPSDDPALMEEHTRLRDQIISLHAKYREMLPVLPLSRCPHSGRLLYQPIDPYGLDGLWWDYEHPIRPIERVMDTLLSITGALKPGGPYESAPFLTMPGPEVPYIIPELISMPGCVAVLSTIPIGPHTGYPICYFINPIPPNAQRAPTWGSRSWTFWYSHGGYYWGEEGDYVVSHDYEIEKYLRNGALMWITPGDTTLTLMKGSEGCPYTGCKGRREEIWIREGRMAESLSREE